MSAAQNRPGPGGALDAAARYAGLVLWRGVAAIAFGLVVFHWRRLTLPDLTMLWGCYSFVDGVLVLAAAIRGMAGMPRGLLSLVGMAGIACAGAVLVRPELVAERLVGFVAAWAIVTGLLQLWGAMALRKAVDGDWILVLDGLGAIAFGVALVLWTRLEMVALVWLVGWFAMLLGAFYLGVAIWLRRMRQD